jgi:hypothetical protein
MEAGANTMEAGANTMQAVEAVEAELQQQIILWAMKRCPPQPQPHTHARASHPPRPKPKPAKRPITPERPHKTV